MNQETIQHSEQKKACVNCGAELLYKPGSSEIKCNYCGYEEAIQETYSVFEELELYPYLKKMGAQSHTEKISMLHCKSCGANQHVEENYKSLHCVYCSETLVVEDAYEEEWILPGAVLPFQLTHKQSHEIFRKWVKSLWFAPNKLQKASLDPQKTKGLYIPFWTFDADIFANYTGKRGDYYYVTENYNTIENGENVRKNKQVRKTKWTSTSGSITGFIDDTLINASKKRNKTLPSKITNWNLNSLQTFNSKYLAGFVTEKYTLPLKDGHLKSKEKAHKIATDWACKDIGGDTQSVSSLDLNISKETFKHILLPVYISHYVYNNKKYHFYINGQTATISGKRPYSFWKIFFLVLFILLTITIIVIVIKE
ncbi:DNA helicase PriA [Tenacibaculum sp. Bg11-29]|uniref:DNA helicase PriA n=1 Tax=Tenacibaculum sp. Bg11-29 TaxID=2058306 RepID=UPI000C32BB96|nr:DNA helicase PriA [Tenacibaculum sp. Bg11-29]PKH49989.1 DNA helicase PriA [Tenacibaculum sp. Bg11-29]